MSLENMRGKLNRTEMKKIMAGAGPNLVCACNPTSDVCGVGKHCQTGICTNTPDKNGLCVPN